MNLAYVGGLSRVAYQKACRNRAHARQVCDGRTASQDKHCRNDDVRCQSEEQEDDMGELAPSGANDFQEAGGDLSASRTRLQQRDLRVSVGSVLLDLGSDHREKQNLMRAEGKDLTIMSLLPELPERKHHLEYQVVSISL
jgi:hypothetical protein